MVKQQINVIYKSMEDRFCDGCKHIKNDDHDWICGLTNKKFVAPPEECSCGDYKEKTNEN